MTVFPVLWREDEVIQHARPRRPTSRLQTWPYHHVAVPPVTSVQGKESSSFLLNPPSINLLCFHLERLPVHRICPINLQTGLWTPSSFERFLFRVAFMTEASPGFPSFSECFLTGPSYYCAPASCSPMFLDILSLPTTGFFPFSPLVSHAIFSIMP